MGKGGYLGGSSGGTFDEDGTPRFKEGPDAPSNKGDFKNRWSENATVDRDARLAAKQYRKLGRGSWPNALLSSALTA